MKPNDRKKNQQVYIEEEHDDTYDLDQEADEALYCHEYGPCKRCIARKDKESDKTNTAT